MTIFTKEKKIIAIKQLSLIDNQVVAETFDGDKYLIHEVSNSTVDCERFILNVKKLTGAFDATKISK